MRFASLVLLFCLGTTLMPLRAQTPATVVVPAATPGHVAAPATQTPSAVGDQSSAIRLLQDMEAANADVLKKQQATLATLDELQKAAEELKIFSKRG